MDTISEKLYQFPSIFYTVFIIPNAKIDPF